MLPNRLSTVTLAFASLLTPAVARAQAGSPPPPEVPSQADTSPSSPPPPAAGAPNAPSSAPAPAPASPAPVSPPASEGPPSGAAPLRGPTPAIDAAKPRVRPEWMSPAAAAQKGIVPADLPRLVLDTGRPVPVPPEPDLVRFQLHGEYQVRYQRQSNILLTPTASRIDAVPGLKEDSLGQTQHVRHWLRLTPSLQIGPRVEIVGQLDLVTGLMGGDLARGTSADEDPRDELDGFKNIQPRWLYATFRTDIGVFRVGQQPGHWGMGVFINDGDHPTLFGDYRYGAIYERIAFVTKPLGKESPLLVGVTGDLVYRDPNAKLTDGDRALQGGMLAILEQDANNQLGVVGIYRSQRRDKDSGSDLFTYTEGLDVGVVDATGKFAIRAPGSDDTFVFGAAELAAVFGTTDLLRRTNLGQIEDTAVRSWGGVGRLGIAHRAHKTSGLDRADITTYGDFVGQMEIGYASGDADPYDNVQRRFSFAPNYKIGLLLFDEVMRWQTSRASTAAQDPLLTNGNRPTPGADRLPSNGAVFGAQYFNPTFVVRPQQWLDLKLGVVVAQTTADLVDPYRVATGGSYVNYRGGSPRRHDLGVEVDTGVEARIPLNVDLTLNVGAQGGVLFPGGALADAGGNTLRTPWLWVGRLGVTY